MANALGWIGTLLEVVLMWRLIHWKAWRSYPFFFGFFVWIFCRLIFLDIQALTQFLSARNYSHVFWITSTITAMLRFLVFWEVYRHALPRHTAPHRFATLLLAGTLAVLAFLLNLAASGAEFYTRIISNLAFALAVCLLIILGLIRYYRVNPGQNIWGMAVGTGIVCAGDVVSFSAFGLDQTLFPITRYVRPATFFVQRAIWLPSLWHYAPPSHPPGGPPGSHASEPSGLPPLSDAVASVRRAVGLEDKPNDQDPGST